MNIIVKMLVCLNVKMTTRRLRLAVRTLGSHPSNRGSTPLGGTLKYPALLF